MLISEAIKELEELKKLYGDLPAFIKTPGRDDFSIVQKIEKSKIYACITEQEINCICIMADEIDYIEVNDADKCD